MEDGRRTKSASGRQFPGGIYRSDTISGAKCCHGQLSHRTGADVPWLSTPDGGNGPQANSLHRLPDRRDLHVRVVRHRDKTCREGTVKVHPSWPQSRCRPQRSYRLARSRSPSVGACRPPAGSLLLHTAPQANPKLPARRTTTPRRGRVVTVSPNTAAATVRTQNPSGRRSSPGCRVS
jgi:hypothetical protein